MDPEEIRDEGNDPHPHLAPDRPHFAPEATDESGIVDELFRFSLENLSGIDFGVYFRASGTRLMPFRAFGIEPSLLSGIAVEQGSGFIGAVAYARRAHLRVDLATDTARDESLVEFYEKTGARSALAAALVAGRTTLAVIVVYSRQVGAFDFEALSSLQHACEVAAPHVANIRGRTETERRLREAELVLQLCGKLEGEHGLANIVGHVADTAKAITGGDTVSVMLVDPETSELWLERADCLSAEPVEQAKIPAGTGISGWVAQHGKPLVVRDFPIDGTNGRVKWAVCVPLGEKENVVGVLNVGSHNRDKAVADEEMRLLMRLSSQAGPLIGHAREYSRMQQLHMQTMRALVSAVEAQDRYARGHAESVARYTVAIANEMGRPPEEVRTLETAALLHDIGKTTLGEGVLGKTRPLTTVEQSAIELHPSIAVDIIGEAPLLADIVPAIEHHHERYDGRGYAKGLAGQEIPLGARILAVADAFDAMTRPRPYRERMSVQAALGELVRESGGQFDPQIVEVFMRLLKENPELASDAGEPE
ncbi:MAG: HD domain-containing protein [Actinobacteria bacterium]|nr:MAG: HD domain-containing protein [Actinomycetota bacterium]